MTIAPEYPGATLTADGSATTNGSMTSDNMLNAGSVGWMNYYEWSSTQAALQDYTIITRVTLPEDFDSWSTGACPGADCALWLAYQTGTNLTADNAVSWQINNQTDTPGTTVCSVADQQSTTWTAAGTTAIYCAESTLNDAGAPEWDAAGETAVIRIKVKAKNTASAKARIGDITLKYRAKF
jgi:hypothetical protein